jgi:hypothetical protein
LTVRDILDDLAQTHRCECEDCEKGVGYAK